MGVQPAVGQWGKDTVPFFLGVLGAQAGQVGLVAVQAPWVTAPPLHMVPIRIFCQQGRLGMPVEPGQAVVREARAAEGQGGL